MSPETMMFPILHAFGIGLRWPIRRRECCCEASTSLAFCSHRAHDPSDALGFARHEGGELARRAGLRLRPLLHDLPDDIGLPDSCNKCGIELVDDRIRGACRRDKAEPGIKLYSVKTGLPHGRSLR